MKAAILGRVLYAVMGLYLTASGIEMLDRSGVTGDDSMVASAAQTVRETRSGDDPFGIIEQAERVVDSYERLAGGLREAGNALD